MTFLSAFSGRRTQSIGSMQRSRSRCRPAAAGFTLYELMITLAIGSGLLVASAGLAPLVQDIRLTSEINTLVGHLNLARSEAITRRQDTLLCPSVDGQSCDKGQDYTWWHRGMLLFVDTNGNGRVDSQERVIREHRPASQHLRIKSSHGRSQVIYQPTGFSSGTNITFVFCDPRKPTSARYVVVSNSGRARVTSKPPDGKADSGLERCQ